MADGSSKFPKFFIYMFSALIAIMVIFAFFSVTAVGNTYFVMLLVVVVFILLDKHYGFFITNYKSIFTMFDLAELVAVLTVICYEFRIHSLTLKIFLSLLVAFKAALILTDALLVKNRFVTKKECLAIDFTQICSMICVLTYFYKVSSFWYSVVAVGLAALSLALKVYVSIKLKHRKVDVPSTEKPSEAVASIGEAEDEGELE